jgi:hypothetical protein
MNPTSRTTAACPPEVLGSYAFIGDGERGALIGPQINICLAHQGGYGKEPLIDLTATARSGRAGRDRSECPGRVPKMSF